MALDRFGNSEPSNEVLTAGWSAANLKTLREDIAYTWSLGRLTLPRYPVVVGTSTENELLKDGQPNVLDMPIKLPGQEFKLPYENLQKLLSTCLTFERMINPEWYENWYCYLTYHRSIVPANNTHRLPGIHFDGVQGAAYPIKLQGCHQYFISNSDELATHFYVKTFDIKDLDVDKHNINEAAARQVFADKTQPVTFGRHNIVFSTAYCAHACATANKDIDRTFVRIEFTQKTYNNAGNTKNPLLKLDWDMKPRPISNALTLPKSYEQTGVISNFRPPNRSYQTYARRQYHTSVFFRPSSVQVKALCTSLMKVFCK